MRFLWRSYGFLPLVCALAACGGGDGGDAVAPAPQETIYPVTRSGDDATVHFGQRVSDPYRWLEDIRSTPVIDWVRAQNAFSAAHVESQSMYAPLYARLAQLQNYETVNLKRQGQQERHGLRQQGEMVQGRYYYQWQRQDHSQRVNGWQRKPSTFTGRSVDNAIYVSEGQGQEGRLLLDVEALARNEPDDAVELLGHQLSEDGRFLAYSLKRNHADLDELHLIDLASASKSPRVLSKTYTGGMVFNGGRFFYAEALEVVQPGLSSFGAQAIQSVVPLRLAEGVRTLYRTGGGQPQGSLSLTVVRKGHLYFQRSATTRRADLMRLDVRTEGASPEMVLDGKGDDTFYLLDDDKAFPGRLLVEASSGSAMKRLISIDPEQPHGGDWRHVLPAQPDEVVHAIELCGAYAYGVQGFGGQAQLTRYALDGATAPKPLALPMTAAVSFMHCRTENALGFQLSTLIDPPRDMRYEPEEDRQVSMSSYIFPNHDPQDYETYQLLVPASDGVQIPVTMAHRKGLVRDGSAPALMYVYGGFNVSLDAGFSPKIVPLLESGGIYVIAHVRGGAEKGRGWYDAGRVLDKSRTYADLADVARYLTAQGYTSAARLGVTGESNGGTSSAAAALLYPELFGVALPKVGVHDLTRYPLFTTGYAWLDDYGHPEVEGEFNNLMGFSPLHNVKRRAYPAMYVITGQNDERVPPGHSYKLAATLQNVASGPGPYLLQAFDKSGHQVEGDPLREKAHALTFFFTHTGTAFKSAKAH